MQSKEYSLLILLLAALILTFLNFSCCMSEFEKEGARSGVKWSVVEDKAEEILDKITGNVIEEIVDNGEKISPADNTDFGLASPLIIYSDESWDNASEIGFAINPWPVNSIIYNTHARWIWTPGSPTANASKIINIDGKIETAFIGITVDNYFRLYVNQEEVFSDLDPKNCQWPFLVDIKKYLEQGENILSIEGWNEYNEVGILVEIRVNSGIPEINHMPELEFIYPNEDIVVVDNRIILKWNAYDPDGDTCIVHLVFKDGNGNGTKIASDLVNVSSYDWDTSNMAEGDYQVYAVIHDTEFGGSAYFADSIIKIKHD